MSTTIPNRLVYNETNKSKIKLNKIQKTNFEKIDNITKTSDFHEFKCIVCNLVDFEIICEIDRHGFYYPTGICKNCGMIQQSKYYSDGFLKKFYSEYYNNFYSQFLGPKQRFDAQYNYAHKSFDFIKGFFSQKNFSVLEVGCGAGGILKYYEENGCIVKGIDYDQNQLNYGRNQGLSLENKIEFLDKKKYDLVILSHVLEHLVYPNKEIKEIKKYLKINGLLYIAIPSIHSIKNTNYNFDMSRFFHIAHFSHFSLTSFKNFMNKNGLKIKKINNEIQAVLEIDESKNDIKKITSSYDADIKELRDIEKYFQKNKYKLKIKKIIQTNLIKLLIRIKNMLPLEIYSFLKKTYYIFRKK